jgi:uncharacterized repeat protein (TIGR01451 family)
MRGLVWKIALLTAVLAVGFLVILQAQRGMTQAMLQKAAAEGQAATTTTPASATAASEPVTASTSAPKADPFGDAPPTHESSHTADSKTAESKVVPPLSAADILANDSAKPPEKPPAATASKDAAAGNDPFGDGADAKHPMAAADARSSPAPGEVKQASGSTDVASKSLDPTGSPPNAATAAPGGAGPKLPDSDGPDLGNLKPSDRKSNEPKSLDSKASDPDFPPKQSEPSSSGSPIDPSADQKLPESKGTDPKSSGGPQLPTPGPALELPPTQNAPAQSEPKPDTAAAAPALDTPAPMRLEPADKAPAKSTAADTSASTKAGGPKPFPEDAAKEAPLPVPNLPAPTASPSNTSTAEPPALDLTPPNSAPPTSASSSAPALIKPETKSADATSATIPAARSAAEPRPEGAADFQGDGTVGDAAPLGPQRPQLNIEKIAPQNALIGQPLIYSIMVKNVGQSAARDVVVEDRIPKGTKLSGTIPRAELTGKKLIWRIGTLGAGEQRKISIRVIPQEAGEIGSVATVNFVAEAAAETVVTAPRLDFKVSAPSSAKLGELVPFRFEVKNIGTGEARGVVIRDLIPQGLSHSAGNDLEYEVGRLPPGKSKELTLDLKAGKVGTAVNRAVVLAEGGLTAEAKAVIEISGSKIALSRSGPPRRYLGRQAVFANTLVNESSFPVDGVVLVESLPTGMEFAGASHGGQYNDGSRTIAWRIEPMAPGETRVVKSRLVARALGNQNSTIRLTVPNGEPVEATSQTQVEGFAALGLDVTGVDGPVDLGEKMTLHVNARNKGTVAVSNLVVTVEVPEQMEIVSARGPGKTEQEPGRLKFGPVPTLEGRTAAACEIVLVARKRGDSRVRVSIHADQIDKPLTREESILILSESPEPTASR